MKINQIALLAAALLLSCSAAQAQTAYQKPPKAVLDVLNAPSSPGASISPTRDRMLLTESARYPSIAELAEPMLRIAGLRINPNTNGPHRPGRVIGLTLKNIADGKETKIKLPPDANIGFSGGGFGGGGGGFGGFGGGGNSGWSADGKQFVFTNTTATGIELWVGNAATGAVRRIAGVTLNDAYGDAVQWLPDNRTLLCQTVVAGRGKAPTASSVPGGPNVQESYGRQSPAPTFQDLLKNSHDEALFEYYATSQLVLVNSASGSVTPLGKPAIIASVEPSPDGNHLLVVTNHKPYSYILTAGAFPKEVEVWDRAGKVEHKLASLPLAEQVPLEGVPTGPRNYNWRPTEAATLVWAEALDGGDTRKPAPLRDRVLMLKAPFKGAPAEIAKTEYRYAGITWGEKGLALLRDTDRARRRARTFLLNVDDSSPAPKLVWDRGVQDRYNDPGTPVLRTLPNGQRVLHQSGNHIFLNGQGASRQGDRPFLDRFDLTTLKSERLFHCDEKSYESAVALLAEDGSRFITRRETPTEPPNYFIRTTGDAPGKALTNFPDPTPQLRSIKKELVTYQRADGVPLSFTLYLPPNYQPGTPLPTIIWAYPREFGDADTAGQISGSTKRFTTISGPSHLFYLLAGYAILDDATMPVIGDPETMNNTYVEQTVASAKAAIDKAVELGVTDRNRVGVGGHSYGAFMTANLLAHSDLFKAGVARSGAYNRTLTPFGFQAERRTLWQAAETYLKMSPFMFADKIKEPILLIHGEADNNSGTFPIQSDRMYQALKGNGGNVRYVTLPLESHGYAARETTEHVLWEMINWMDKHVKQSSPTAMR